MFDFDSFREAWINACVHNHWINELPPSIFLYDDRIEIFSYGDKPFNLTNEQFYSGTSLPINKTLFDIFDSLRLFEQTGHGIPIIVNKYGKNVFLFKNSTTTVVIPFNYIPDYVFGRRIKEAYIDKLTINQKNILNFLKENPNSTQINIANKLSLSIQCVKNATLKLQELGVLERCGSKKYGLWKVKIY